MKIYVEGGGDKESRLRREVRDAFCLFLKKAGLNDRMPSIVACGSRSSAFKQFRVAVTRGRPAMLLVDSEGPVSKKNQSPTASPEQWKPWAHLGGRKDDKWQRPDRAEDMDCHLMVQAMEAWILTDRDALVRYFGKELNSNALPPETKACETVGKTDLLDRLKNASKDSAKGAYDKGAHSFKILALLDPLKVEAASPWAKRFLDALRARCAAPPEGKRR